MTTTSDFTPDENELLYDLPFIVAGTSLAAVHVSAFKAVKTAISFYVIVRDTSKQFPDDECIQSIFAHKNEDQAEQKQRVDPQSANGKEEAIRLRNQFCEQTLGTLSTKARPQEVENYKRWLFLVAEEVMQKAHSNGFLGLGRGRAEEEIAQALQDFRQVLQIEQ